MGLPSKCTLWLWPPVGGCCQAVARWATPFPGGGGGGGAEAQKTVCVPKIGLKFPAPLINFIVCRRNTFLMWGGGRPGAGQGPKQHPGGH